MKDRLSNTPMLALSDFTQPFEVVVNACGNGIGAVLSQHTHPIEYFSEKLSEARKKWSTYEQELYSLVRALKLWEHYLLGQDFILFYNHLSLKYLQTQKNISRMHARWLSFIQCFNFMIKHRAGSTNVVANAFSRKANLLTILKSQAVAFDSLPTLYEGNPDFGQIWSLCIEHVYCNDFHLTNDFLFKNNLLCIPRTSLPEALIKELHSNGLARHFGIEKTYQLLSDVFY